MNAKCKSCPKREDCNVQELTADEQNLTLNFLLQFEQSIGRTINFTLNGRNAGVQWIFFKVMSNKMRNIAKNIEAHLSEAPDDDIDWDNVTSIEELADDYIADNDEKDDSQDRESDWFNGDIKGV